MGTSPRFIDDVFRALSDPTRRAVVARLAKGAASTKTLHEPFTMALPSFVQHMSVLEGCGVVASTKVGRVRTYRLVPARLRRAEDWLATQRDLWETRLNQLDRYLEQQKEDET